MYKIVKSVLLKSMALSALPMAKISANITCSGCLYQDKLPEAVKQFRKF